MNDYFVGCRVKCVDASPFPINVPDAEVTDFSFPGGFIEKGSVYCVCWVGVNNRGRPSLRLVGHPVIHGSIEIPWDGLRFRRLPRSTERRRRQPRRKPRKLQAATAR